MVNSTSFFFKIEIIQSTFNWNSNHSQITRLSGDDTDVIIRRYGPRCSTSTLFNTFRCLRFGRNVYEIKYQSADHNKIINLHARMSIKTARILSASRKMGDSQIVQLQPRRTQNHLAVNTDDLISFILFRPILF